MSTSPDELRGQPSLAQQVAEFEQMVEQVERRLAEDLDLSGWSTAVEGSESLCDEGEVEDARVAALPTRLLTGGVPDAVWAAAVERLVEVAGAYGFGPAETVVDNPGEHEVVLRGEREALIRFGTLQHATLDVLTGCHLRQAAQER